MFVRFVIFELDMLLYISILSFCLSVCLPVFWLLYLSMHAYTCGWPLEKFTHISCSAWSSWRAQYIIDAMQQKVKATVCWAHTKFHLFSIWFLQSLRFHYFVVVLFISLLILRYFLAFRSAIPFEVHFRIIISSFLNFAFTESSTEHMHPPVHANRYCLCNSLRLALIDR